MKERIKEVVYWFESKLKDLCGEITPDKRLTVIVVMLLLFTILNLYFTFSSIRNWGKEKENYKELEIEHIRELELREQKYLRDMFDSPIKPLERDSVLLNYENERL